MSFQVGQKVKVEIVDIAFGGEGVARIDDFVVFVPFVLAGEVAEVEIIELKKRFARARLLKVLKASGERVEPRCRYFGDCGGCQYQHMAYPVQLQLKQKQIADLFQRVGGITEAPVDPVLPCPAPYGYRNRIMVRSQWDKIKQGLNIGYIRYDNRLVVDVECCPIAEPALNEQLASVRAHPPPKGGLKVVLRVPPPGWEVPPDSFFQNNFHLLPGLVKTVRDRISESGVRYLLDLYCGVGFFSLEVADLVESFVGVELDARAIRAARLNAEKKGRQNGEFISARAEDCLPELLERFPAAQTAVILDPPRTGCPPESLELIRSAQVAQILYVSCHPATLARDVQLLVSDATYQLARVTPLDMFPQTQHVECVTDLRRRVSTSSS